MTEIKVNDNTYKLKKDYLTNGEVNYLVSKVLEIYNEGNDIEGYRFSPLSMMANFYSLLFQYCIEDFDDIENMDKFNELYNNGVQKILLEKITNAQEALDLVIKTSDKISGLENIIDINLQNLIGKIIDRIPDTKTFNKMINKLPKEWQKVATEYKNITELSEENSIVED